MIVALLLLLLGVWLTWVLFHARKPNRPSVQERNHPARERPADEP